MMVEMYRQGDLLLVKVKSIPKKAKEKKDKIILEGEVTGHAHCIEVGVVLLNNDDIFVKAEENTQLTHDEHGSIDLPEGNYKVIRQREYVDIDLDEGSKDDDDIKMDKDFTFYRFVCD